MENVFAYIKRNVPLCFVVALCGVNVLFAALIFSNKQPGAPVGQDIPRGSYSEIEYLKGRLWQFSELSSYFTDLAQEKGGRYAYEVLKTAPTLPNIDMHLLGHVVGDELYKQEGAAGMSACNEDFRNACSHAIVVGLFTDQGDGALPDIIEACKKAPGGRGAYGMCFHGLGHGILAAVGYDMHKAVEICKKTSVRQPSEEINQCASGTVMEIIGGGFHDREFWSVQRLKYLSTERPLEPCSLDYIPDAAKPMCYAYLTPHLFDAAGSDAGNPNPAHFKDAFLFCGSLPLSETGNRDACYGGFGKEFVVLANSRDTRKGALENFADGGLMKVHEWCALAPHEEALFSCTTHAVDSFYWGGENDRRIALRFCDLASETVRPVCVQHLIGIVSYFIQDEAYRRGFCAEVPEAYRTKCEAQLF